MRIFRGILFVLILSLLAAGCRSQVMPASSPTTEPTASATESPSTPTPSPTYTPVPTPTSTPTPSPTPTPTPRPDKLEWLNPITGEAVTLPAACYTPEVQAIVQWAQEDPEGLVQAWIDYWDGYFQAHPGLMEQKRFDPKWYTWFFEAPHAYGVMAQLGEVPMPSLPQQASNVYIRFPTLLLGLADKYEYPDLGVTVFTACALIYDNDLATRVYSIEELEAMPTDEVTGGAEGKLLMRPDPENAQPRWYLGEVAVAYAVHPDSWLNEVEPASGEIIVTELAPGEVIVGEPEFATIEAAITPGCYYPLWPEAVRQQSGVDPDCSLLEDLAEAMGTYVGMVLLEDKAADLLEVLTLNVRPLSMNLAEVGLNADFYAMPRDSMSREEWKANINEVLLEQTFKAYEENPTQAQSMGVARTLALVTLAWKEAQPSPDAPLCTAQRALFHYKLRRGLLSPLCSMEEVAQSDYWILLDEKPLFFDGEPFLLSIEDLLAGRE